MRRITVLFAALLLCGCISLLPKAPPPPRTFALDAGAVAALEGAPLNVVLAVAPPQGERTLLGFDLAWRTGAEIASVAQTRWTARAQDALQAIVIDTVSRQGGVRAAVRPGEARADFEVRWSVRDFEVIEEGGRMTARFAANVLLVDVRDAHIVGVRDIEAETPVASRSSSQAAESLTRAAREGGARIGQFVMETLRAADQPSTASSNK